MVCIQEGSQFIKSRLCVGAQMALMYKKRWKEGCNGLLLFEERLGAHLTFLLFAGRATARHTLCP